MNLHLFIAVVSTKIYDKCEDFFLNFNFYLMCLALHAMEYIFLNSSDLLEHLVMHVANFNTPNKLLTQIFFKQGY